MMNDMTLDSSKHSTTKADDEDDESFLRRAGVSKQALATFNSKEMKADEGFNKPMSASALLGAMEGLLKDPTTHEPSRSIALAAVSRNAQVIKVCVSQQQQHTTHPLTLSPTLSFPPFPPLPHTPSHRTSNAPTSSPSGLVGSSH